MNAEKLKRLLDRIQVKDEIRRLGLIGPDEAMYSNAAPMEYVCKTRAIPKLDTIAKRAKALNEWIDEKLPPLSSLPPMPSPGFASFCKGCGDELLFTEDMEEGLCLDCINGK